MITGFRQFTHDDDTCKFEAAGYEVAPDGHGWWLAIRYHDNDATVLGRAPTLKAAKAIVDRHAEKEKSL